MNVVRDKIGCIAEVMRQGMVPRQFHTNPNMWKHFKIRGNMTGFTIGRYSSVTMDRKYPTGGRYYVVAAPVKGGFQP